MIAIADHPLNLDQTASLVSGPREQISIFRTSRGYVASNDGMALEEVFATEQEARAALDTTTACVSRLVI